MEEAVLLLDLNSLFAGRAGLTPSEGGHLAECAVVCYNRSGHSALPVLDVSGRMERRFNLSGPTATNRMRRTYGDVQEATEYGACGIAALVVEACEGLTILERAPKDGGGFDYFLAPLPDASEFDNDNFFAEATAALEVSGLLQGTVVDVQYRLHEKMRRLQGGTNMLPTFVVVVSFSASVARLERL
jgi:hypothetical protein